MRGAALLIVWPLSLTLFAHTPQSLGQQPDGGMVATILMMPGKTFADWPEIIGTRYTRGYDAW